jgi:replicative DNA helicase
MTCLASEYARSGMNVLYVTGEMSEKCIIERMYSHLADIPMNEISQRILAEKNPSSLIKGEIKGNIAVKEFPTASASVDHIRYTMKELESKRGFKPDVVFLDYLNLFRSTRYLKAENTYTVVKGVAEEFRGLMAESGCIGWTASQSNRGGFNKGAELDQSDISESIGVVYTADLMIAIINTEELEAQGQYLFKVIKNRFGDTSKFSKFLVNVDKSKMRITDCDFEYDNQETQVVKPSRIRLKTGA